MTDPNVPLGWADILPADWMECCSAADAALTPEQALDYHLGRIRTYALDHGLSGEAVVLTFEAGMRARASAAEGEA